MNSKGCHYYYYHYCMTADVRFSALLLTDIIAFFFFFSWLRTLNTKIDSKDNTGYYWKNCNKAAKITINEK